MVLSVEQVEGMKEGMEEGTRAKTTYAKRVVDKGRVQVALHVVLEASPDVDCRQSPPRRVVEEKGPPRRRRGPREDRRPGRADGDRLLAVVVAVERHGDGLDDGRLRRGRGGGRGGGRGRSFGRTILGGGGGACCRRRGGRWRWRWRCGAVLLHLRGRGGGGGVSLQRLRKRRGGAVVGAPVVGRVGHGDARGEGGECGRCLASLARSRPFSSPRRRAT